MNTVTKQYRESISSQTGLHTDQPPKVKALVTVITPAYNEAAIIEDNIGRLRDYLHNLKDQYDWELLIVNDGSKDETGELADALADRYEEVRVIHHRVNRNLGCALQTGFQRSKGDYVIVMDLDLTYAEDHIEQLMEAIVETDADMVIASPYMPGGKNTAVPTHRLLLSRVVNYLMRIMSPKKIYTFTGMVRAYKGNFVRQLNLKSGTYAINPEIIHKAIILRARIEEIPAHLDWTGQDTSGRTSGIKIFKGIINGLMSSFIFRPYFFFMSVGGVLLLISLYLIAWIFIHTFTILPELPANVTGWEDRFSAAVAEVFRTRPHAFLVGGVALIVAFQFLGIGFLSLQSKRYFDELFHINSRLIRR